MTRKPRAPVSETPDAEGYVSLDWKPPWRARNEREREQMRAWVKRELNRLPDPLELWLASDEYKAGLDARSKQYDAWLNNLGPQIESAEAGNIEPLRAALPHLAKFIHLPKRRQGERSFPKFKDALRVSAACDDVDRIRALWKQHYGRKNRHAEDGPSAEEIAADRWEVDVEAVIRSRAHLARLTLFPPQTSYLWSFFGLSKRSY